MLVWKKSIAEQGQATDPHLFLKNRKFSDLLCSALFLPSVALHCVGVIFLVSDPKNFPCTSASLPQTAIPILLAKFCDG
ncbi:hypothetical protein SLEP1_g26024 [Rubroshorea leprosula]|uniref:Uncharacterized protein n=1 Tax=Rubroshorea leprosula TaxID=152421 RepID=A0AAV5JRW4_9ROSI|nr:hypothetical protein SLEP1_g26024 [Rubroshorea leprosula]